MSVVDASALVDALVVVGPAGDVARAVTGDLDLLQVPAIFLAEVSSALRMLVLTGDLEVARAQAAAVQASEMRTQEHPFLPFLARAWELRDNLTPYDAWYVALAERLQEPLVTADRRLARTPGPRCEIILTCEKPT